MSEPQRLLAFLVLLSALAVALRAVSHRSRLPYPVVLAAGGILVGLIPGARPGIVGPDLILLVFVPGLVFQAAFTLHLDQLRRLLTPVALLATLGVAAVVLAMGAVLHATIGLTWSDDFILAAILSPTDPIAVVSVLRTIPAPPHVTTLLEGESLLNDATGVAIFAALVASVTGGTPGLGDVGVRFLAGAGLGVAVGLGWGALAVPALRWTTEPALEFLTTLTVAYGAYLTADVLHGSGIFAVVVAALTLVISRRRLHLHGDRLLDFWDLTGFLLNALVFMLIGTALPSGNVIALGGTVVVGFAVLAILRLATVYPILAVTDWRGNRIRWRSRPLVVWGGMRGALSVALALSVQSVSGVDQRVVTIAYGVVVFSLLVQGSTVRPLVRLMTAADQQHTRHLTPNEPISTGP